MLDTVAAASAVYSDEMTCCNYGNVTSVLLQPVHLESDSPDEDELVFFDHPCPRYDQHVTKNEVSKFSFGCLFVCLFFSCCCYVCHFSLLSIPCCILQSLSEMIDSFMDSSAIRAVVERVQAQIDPGTTVTPLLGGCLS